MSDIQAADPKARRLALLLIVMVLVVTTLALLVFEAYRPDLVAWLFVEPERLAEKLNWILLLFVIPAIPLLWGSVYIWRVGSAAIKARRFPPPNFAVVRDTAVIDGQKAAIRGHVLRIASVLFAGCAAGVPFIFWCVLRTLLGV